MKSILLLLSLFSLFTPYCHAQISGITASASNEYNSETNSSNVLDGSLGTNWNSGGAAPQWIMLDLKSPTTINQIKLTINQTPTGRSIHEISGGPNPSSLSPIITLDQITSNDQTITVSLPKPISNIQYLKITTTLSTSWVSWKEIKIYQGTTKANSNLKYFGYMSLEGLGVEGLNKPKYYSDLTYLGNTNIAWSYTSDINEYISRGIKPIITELRWIFFTDGNLSPNWQANWSAFQRGLGDNAKNIYGFYFDEPLWQGKTKEAFVTATRAIHDAYPDKAIIVVEAAPPIDNGTIPSGYYDYVTDIGFDYYFTRENSDNYTGWEKYLSLYEKFKPYIGNKKYWLIPDGYAANTAQSSRWSDAWERYYSLAQSTDNIAGMFGFIYNGGETSLTLSSVLTPGSSSYNPTFSSRQIDMGKSIISNNIATVIPTTIPTSIIIIKKSGDANGDNIVNLIDFSIWKSEYLKQTNTKNTDFNKDGIINLLDFVLWKTEYLK